jgi:SNF2 family DNA or RNA helicase
MIRFDGTRIYPTRISDTLSHDLSQGEISEQRLYDLTTDYIQTFYNRARILNRSAARMAMSVFQRRLASSTHALICSFERRIAKIDGMIDDIQSGKIGPEELATLQREMDDIRDVLDEMTGDEESREDGYEQNELMEEMTLGGVVAVSLAELQAERNQVTALRDLARDVAKADDFKFEKLREVIDDARFKHEKILIFTEHRDTLNFLIRRLEGLGFTGQVAKIHGGMGTRPSPATGLSERDEQVEFFKRSHSEGGARFMVATDAAGEGINLQFCWLMINYDIPWNPARLEQRMGRIHRYGQQHDPVIIVNLISGKNRGPCTQDVARKVEFVKNSALTKSLTLLVGSLKVFHLKNT